VIDVDYKTFTDTQSPLSFICLSNQVTVDNAEVILIDQHFFKKTQDHIIQEYLDSGKMVYIDSTYELMEFSILERIANFNYIHNVHYFYVPRENEEHNELLCVLKEKGLNCVSKQFFIHNADEYKPDYDYPQVPYKPYACLTGKPKVTRIFLVSLLSKYGLLEKGHVSFFGLNNVEPSFIDNVDIFTTISSSAFDDRNKQIMYYEMSKIAVPLTVDTEIFSRTVSHERNFNARIYDAVDFVVVAETHLLSDDFFVTEKTIKCIVMNKKFIAVAGRFYIKKLKEYYLQNFSKDISHLTDWCDTSYDDIEALEDRITRVVEIVSSVKEIR